MVGSYVELWQSVKNVNKFARLPQDLHSSFFAQPQLTLAERAIPEDWVSSRNSSA